LVEKKTVILYFLVIDKDKFKIIIL